MVSTAEFDKGREDKADNDDPVDDVSVPIPAESVSQHLPDEKNAKGDGIHLRHHLVGLRPQPHRLLHRLSREYTHTHELLFSQPNPKPHSAETELEFKFKGGRMLKI